MDMHAELVLDFGNAFVKWYAPGEGAFNSFRHAIAPLTDAQWRGIIERAGTPPDGYLLVNDAPFAVGDAARRHTIQERPKGAARYEATYYGIGLAYALATAFKRSVKPLTLYASHAPGDVGYAKDLVSAARGVWRVEMGGKRYVFSVADVHTYDEPFGGFNHFVLNADGSSRKNNPIRNETVLVCDVGGYTTDVGAIDPGGEVDTASFRSTRTGVIGVIDTFTQSVRANNRLFFKNTGDLDPRRVDEAIRTGVYKGGKMKLNCQMEADEACQTLVNDVEQIINAAGGAANFDRILLTGGGSALIGERLAAQMPMIEFHPVDPDIDQLQYANVFGGAKFFKLLKRMGVI